MAKAQQRRQTVPAHVDVEIPAVPTTTQVPQNLLKTLIWVGGVVVLGLGGWVSYNLIKDHNEAAVEKHDAQFSKKEDVEKAKTELAKKTEDTKAVLDKKMEDHERQDVQSINRLADLVGQSLSASEVARQYLYASNKEIILRLDSQDFKACQKENTKNPTACGDLDRQVQRSLQAAQKAKDDADVLSQKARAVTLPTLQNPGTPPTK